MSEITSIQEMDGKVVELARAIAIRMVELNNRITEATPEGYDELVEKVKALPKVLDYKDGVYSVGGIEVTVPPFENYVYSADGVNNLLKGMQDDLGILQEIFEDTDGNGKLDKLKDAIQAVLDAVDNPVKVTVPTDYPVKDGVVAVGDSEYPVETDADGKEYISIPNDPVLVEYEVTESEDGKQVVSIGGFDYTVEDGQIKIGDNVYDVVDGKVSVETPAEPTIVPVETDAEGNKFVTVDTEVETDVATVLGKAVANEKAIAKQAEDIAELEAKNAELEEKVASIESFEASNYADIFLGVYDSVNEPVSGMSVGDVITRFDGSTVTKTTDSRDDNVNYVFEAKDADSPVNVIGVTTDGFTTVK